MPAEEDRRRGEHGSVELDDGQADRCFGGPGDQRGRRLVEDPAPHDVRLRPRRRLGPEHDEPVGLVVDPHGPEPGEDVAPEDADRSRGQAEAGDVGVSAACGASARPPADHEASLTRVAVATQPTPTTSCDRVAARRWSWWTSRASTSETLAAVSSTKGYGPWPSTQTGTSTAGPVALWVMLRWTGAGPLGPVAQPEPGFGADAPAVSLGLGAPVASSVVAARRAAAPPRAAQRRSLPSIAASGGSRRPRPPPNSRSRQARSAEDRPRQLPRRAHGTVGEPTVPWQCSAQCIGIEQPPTATDPYGRRSGPRRG